MRKRAAFTLVELLVVIGIISLLIAMLMPSLKKAREQARLVSCQSNLRQIAILFRMYSMDYAGCAPMMVNVPATPGPYSEWMVQIAPYLKMPPGSVSANWNLPTWGPDAIRLLQCPSTYPTINIWGRSSYGVNYFFTFKGDNDQYKQSAYAWWLDRPLDGPNKLTDARILKRSSEFVIAGESVSPDWLIPWWYDMNLYTHVHAKLRNYVFVDGHVDASKQETTKYLLYIFNSGQLYRGRNNHMGTPPYEY